MRLFQNISIRRKQMLIIMLTSSAVLLLASTAFVVHEISGYRDQLRQRISSVAEVIANTCTAALDFKDARSAEEALGALHAEGNIISACIYDSDGEIFATYQRNRDRAFTPPVPQPEGSAFADGQLHLFRKVILNGESIGTIYIGSDLTDISGKLGWYAVIVGLVLAASLLVALVISARLQRIVSDPLLHLANLARKVAIEKNYSLRARKQSNDEIGQLIDGFNHMLAQIQERDSALEAARDTLEHRVAERTRELANSLSLLHATLNSTTDGILAVNLAGRVVCYNEKFAAMWNLPADILQSESRDQLVAWNTSLVKNPQEFTKRLKQIQSRPEAEAFDVIPLTDGRTFERFVHPQRVGDECVGCVLNFRDITERKKSEASLEQAHRELVQASRHAGMAEVATNVLHNVGNVLNSVNTSASVVMDQIRNSKITGVARMAGLLQEHEHNLAGFFSGEKRSEQFLTYLNTLAQHLAVEHQTVLKELGDLTRNVEHIKEIVAMQQNYAKVSGFVEVHSVSLLVEDALRIHAGALERHDIRVERQFAPVPEILVDKHKVLQILVNLIGNAKYALSDGSLPERRLTLGVSLFEPERRVRISVRDNGMGISPDNLTRIFSHGFTTRKNGHGFGLHSGFLAAREMGGALSVSSEGAGKGATFTLELPFNPSKNHEN